MRQQTENRSFRTDNPHGKRVQPESRRRRRRAGPRHLSAIAYAQAVDINEKALLLDTRGAPVMSSGLCWHSAYGPAPMWTAGCHAAVPATIAQYVAPAATAAPVAAAVPLPIYEKVALHANVLFDSNRSSLRPAGRDALDAFVKDIGGLEAQSVLATGFADRMGSEASNQVLSEERASMVKSYLVSKGVATDRVHTGARGESRPSTDAMHCKDGSYMKNVACMQVK